MRALLCALAALLITAAPAPGATIGVRDDVRAAGVALAGPDVIVMSELRDGSTQLVALPRTGGPARTLLTVPSVQPVFEAHGQLAASAQRVALITEIEDRRERTVEYRVYAGPPSGPLQIVRRLPAHEGWEPVLVDAEGDQVLIVEASSGGGPLRSFILDPAFGLTPAGWAGSPLTPVALAGERAAAIDAAGRRLVVVDRAGGAEQASLTQGEASERVDFDLAADGRLAYSAAAGISVTGPGLPAQLVPRSRDLSRGYFAGAALTAFDKNGTPLLLAPDGARTSLGPPTTVLTASDTDEQGFAWIANGCLHYAAVPVTAAPPRANDPCPTTEISLAYIASSKLRGRTVRVPLYCVTAPKDVCRGTILGRDGEGGRRFVARGRFAVPVGKSRDVPMRIERATLERFKRKHFGFFIIDARIPDGRIGQGGGGDSELGVDLD